MPLPADATTGPLVLVATLLTRLHRRGGQENCCVIILTAKLPRQQLTRWERELSEPSERRRDRAASAPTALVSNP